MAMIKKMVRPNDGGSAFPFDSDRETEGLSKRDWFAGQALAGNCGFQTDDNTNTPLLVEEAYRIADAMLKQRAVRVEIEVDSEEAE